MRRTMVTGVLLLLCSAWAATAHAAQRPAATCDRECLRGKVTQLLSAPVMLLVRLKVVADRITEIELVATRSRAEGLIFKG